MPDYRPGTPSWIELHTPDHDAAASFYGDLFGWSATEPGPIEETGGYRMFMQGEARIAGLMGHHQEGQPTVWSTYVSVEDADAAAAAATEAGGSMIVEPMDVTDIGRMAFFADPAGAVLGVWQPKSFAGADLVNEPVSLCWNELATTDNEGAIAFYTKVFGWKTGDGPGGGDDPYTVWELDGNPVGGLSPEGMLAEGMPPNWGVCFTVSDADAVCAKAGELGGSVVHPVTDIPIGRFAVVLDPQGAAFAVMQFPEQA